MKNDVDQIRLALRDIIGYLRFYPGLKLVSFLCVFCTSVHWM